MLPRAFAFANVLARQRGRTDLESSARTRRAGRAAGERQPPPAAGQRLRARGHCPQGRPRRRQGHLPRPRRRRGYAVRVRRHRTGDLRVLWSRCSKACSPVPFAILCFRADNGPSTSITPSPRCSPSPGPGTQTITPSSRAMPSVVRKWSACAHPQRFAPRRRRSTSTAACSRSSMSTTSGASANATPMTLYELRTAQLQRRHRAIPEGRHDLRAARPDRPRRQRPRRHA